MTIHLFIDLFTSTNPELQKWLDCVRKYLQYGLEQKGFEVTIKEGYPESGNEITVYLPVLSAAFFSDAANVQKVQSAIASGNSNQIVLGMLKESAVTGQVSASFPELKILKMFVLDRDHGQEISDKDLWKKENFNFFLFKIYDLSNEVERALGTLLSNESKGRGKTVYLAEASPDLIPVREEIRRELIRTGYEVVPNKPLPVKMRDAEKVINEYLSQSVLSIHLLGKLYQTATGGDYSQAELENRVAAGFFAAKKESRFFKRVIWMPDGLIVSDEKQIRFIDAVQRDKKLYAGADVIRSSVEEVKDIIFEKLEESNSREDIKTKGGSGSGGNSDRSDSTTDRKIVYIVNSEKNTEGAEEVKKILETFGCDVKINRGERETYREELKNCNSVLFYYNNEKPSWLRSKMCEVYKMKSWEYTSTFASRGVITFENTQLPADQLFKGVVQIRGDKELNYKHLSQFFYKAN